MKYIEFYRFLENNTKEKLELIYEDIEKIIGEKLPNSANNHSAYFSNSLSHPISKIWLELGYTQTKLELGKYLILEKVKEKEVMNISKLDKAIKNFLEKKRN